MTIEHLAVHITGEAKQLGAEFRKVASEAESSGGRMHGAMSKAGKIGAAALAGLAAGAVAVGVEAIHMADDFEKSHARLQVALKNSGISWSSQSKAIKAADDAGVKFGYNKSQIEDALAVAIRGTGNAEKGYRILSIAQDLAAATGKDLETSTLAVTRASEGQLRPLKQLGIDLPVAAGGALKTQTAFVALGKAQENLAKVEEVVRQKHLQGAAALKLLDPALQKVHDAQDKFNTVSKTGNTILDALQTRLKGSASAAADTFQGKVNALKAAGQNLFIQVGMFLIPIITGLANVILDHVIPAIRGFIGWIETKAIPAVQDWIKHTGWARDAVDKFKIGLNQINTWKDNGGVKKFFDGAFKWATDASMAVAQFFGIYLDNSARVAGTVGGGTLFHQMQNPQPFGFVPGYSGAPKGLVVGGRYMGGPGQLSPGEPGYTPPHIGFNPHGGGRHAAGGIVTGPQWGLLGEAGPEAIIPLTRANGLGGTTYVVNVNVHGPSFGANTQYHAATAEAVVNQLVQHQMRRGTHWQFVQGTGPG